MTQSGNGWGGATKIELEGWRGEIHQDFMPLDLAAAIAKVTDPGQALETLHWGRNYLYTQEWQSGERRFEIVVKQFRSSSFKARWQRRRRGSKAERSFRAAGAITECGVMTPAPILFVDAAEIDGPSYYVCVRVEEVLEARYLLRAMNASRRAELFPDIDSDRFLDALGALIRRLHDGGFWHRDMTSGNVLLRPRSFAPQQASVPDINASIDALTIVDLNRARFPRNVGLLARTKDLSRMPIFQPSDRQRFLASYWQQRPNALQRLSASVLFALYHYGFRAKNRTKQGVRGGLRTFKEALLPRRAAHAHIPPPAADAGARDKIVWDHLSDQPHQHAGRLQKLRVRLADAPSHGRALGAAALAVPRILRRYGQLKSQLESAPAPMLDIGIALRPWSDRDALLAELDALGLRHGALRLHPWQDDHEAERSLAAALHKRGYDLLFTLPQNRDLVRDPQTWQRSVRELGRLFSPYGQRFQIGQAINRSKWGVWTVEEYTRLFVLAKSALREVCPQAELLGPAVIDFEFHMTAALLNLKREGLSFDAVASLLYVDRRGAPESTQLGFDTVGKVLLLKAIAETSRNCPSGRSVVTEVNWPLHEGPHSPAGRDVAVDEERQADYLVRYYLLALSTGAVEAVYWWQLIARGYGLIDPGGAGLRRRPAFTALQQLNRCLAGSTYLGRLVPAGHAGPDVILMHFKRASDECVVGWCTEGGPTTVEIERPVLAAVDRSGDSVACSPPTIVVDSSPRYFQLATESARTEQATESLSDRRVAAGTG